MTALSLSGGCSVFNRTEKYNISKYKDYKPQGEIPRKTLGKTGILVSQLGFGSHMKKELVGEPEYRDRMIKLGFEAGINFFDVYDHKIINTVMGRRVEVDHKQFKPMGKSIRGFRKEAVVSLVTVRPTDQMQDEIDGALRAFQTDYIDLYRLYGVDDDRMNIMEKNKKAGKKCH